jgi:hypothetical protein
MVARVAVITAVAACLQRRCVSSGVVALALLVVSDWHLLGFLT